jgi:hypothetical protein
VSSKAQQARWHGLLRPCRLYRRPAERRLCLPSSAASATALPLRGPWRIIATPLAGRRAEVALHPGLRRPASAASATALPLRGPWRMIATPLAGRRAAVALHPGLRLPAFAASATNSAARPLADDRDATGRMPRSSGSALPGRLREKAEERESVQ